ncbi:MAG: ABC transporter ATP-binding protein, partial [Chloroflexi bacterium]|nr:ABC transporter ATP-binding protein [Chloroflexota bacterium]
VFGMLGPNGAGKTTTVEILEGLRIADSGKIIILGLDVKKETPKVKQRIGIQLQAPSLLPLLKVEEVLEVFSSFYSHTLPINELIDMLDLKESRKVMVKHLSGGQQQRLSVAMALANDPDIAFLDEPTTGLDPQSRRGVWSVIENMRNRGKTIFLTTHYMEEAERLCNRVAIIDHGKIIAEDSPDQLIHQNFKETAIEFEIDPPPEQSTLKKLPAVSNVTIDGINIILYSTDIPVTMSAILTYADKNGFSGKLRDLHVRRATLEDVFIKLTGRKIRD